MRCLKLSIIAIKNFCVLYEIIMRSFTICIFNENLIFLNNCASLIRTCDIKFFSVFKFIKHFIFRVLKSVIIVIVQTKTRNLCFRNFNFNVVTTSIKLKLFSSFFRDDFIFFDILRIWNTLNRSTCVLSRHMNNTWFYWMLRWLNCYHCDDFFDFINCCCYFLEYARINLSAQSACLIISHYQLHQMNCFVRAKMFNFHFNRRKIDFEIAKIDSIIDAKIAKIVRYQCNFRAFM